MNALLTPPEASRARELYAALPAELRQTLSWAAGDDPGDLEAGVATPAEPVPWPGVLHEVFAAPPGGQVGRFASYHPFPAGAVIGFAVRQLERSRGLLTVWIGRRVWPYPLVLDRAGLLVGSLMVDAADTNQRLWAAELALRCSAVASVIADGSGFSMSATRRLQLASRESGALMLLARPSSDERELSAAGARWRIAAAGSRGEDASPQWTVELLRCKGVRPVSLVCHGQSHPAWKLRWDAERASTRFIDTDVGHERDDDPAAPVPGGLPADLAGRPSASPPGPPRRVG